MQTLNTRVPKACRDVSSHDSVVAYPYFWQEPAATEKAAYEAIVALPMLRDFEYVGFPWATIIDGLRGDSANASKILMALKHICLRQTRTSLRATVAQHIHAMQFVELFKVVGISDIFWSHATHQQREFDGIRVHPFPLFPVQAPYSCSGSDQNRPRRYLANFVGAYNPKVYLTNVRQAIFDDRNANGDLLIVKRDAWHFDRAVYEEQVKGQPPDDQRLLAEQRFTHEYLNAIRESWFTLCPSGSGPNSIRIFESLCLGSIPIVLTRDLRLPGPQGLWEQAAIIEEDSESGYANALASARSMPWQQRMEKLKSGQRLAQLVTPPAYGRFIVDTISQTRED